ncbi:AraC family transcriptional regulator ligand-binding domain-containing protein [Nonomuraea sp. NPDC050790]|uniref:AraC family transcriptional regulator ligand-binding domain-containing protein n=1 Tax=Nonomuraea sp. NPDC050790 TaxID=3364371 RepID=UPI003796CF5D
MERSVPLQTMPPLVPRMLIRAGGLAGLDQTAVAGIPGLSLSGHDGIRLPTSSTVRVWEEWSSPIREWGGGAQVLRAWRLGAFGVWDYLFVAAETLAHAFEAGGRHAAAISDPGDGLEPVWGEDGLTVGYRSVSAEHPEFPLIAEFALALLVAEASAGAGRRVVPLRVCLPSSTPRRHGHLVEAFGTPDIDFRAELPSITFSTADVSRRLPRADPVLAAILSEYANAQVAASRPMMCWLDRLRAEVDAAFAEGGPDLARTAHRLGMSPRTLQRRLKGESTSWRDLVEQRRHQRAELLLRQRSLTMESIAARVGYTDARTLRRALHRWYGRGVVPKP